MGHVSFASVKKPTYSTYVCWKIPQLLLKSCPISTIKSCVNATNRFLHKCNSSINVFFLFLNILRQCCLFVFPFCLHLHVCCGYFSKYFLMILQSPFHLIQTSITALPALFKSHELIACSSNSNLLTSEKNFMGQTSLSSKFQ